MADEGTAPPTEGEKAARPRNLYGYVRDAWKDPGESFLKDVRQQRLIGWRRGESFVRLEHPTRIDRARALGWRAKPGFVVVNEYRSGDVHRVDQTKAFGHAAPLNEFLDLRRDIDEPASIRYFKPKMISE